MTAPVSAQSPTRRQRAVRRLVSLLWRIVAWFLLLTFLYALILRFVPVPFTLTMLGDLVEGRGVTKSWTPLSRIDADMPRAAIAAEDGKFCRHHGFDFEAIAGAAARNASGGRIRGGSTITQQAAKNVFLWQGGGFFRKGLEAYFALLIEGVWGKRRIMEIYLNVAETGIGTYGVEAGARRYFGKGAAELTPRQAAQIAAVLPLPKKRAGIAPRGFTARYGRSIERRMRGVRSEALDACVQ